MHKSLIGLGAIAVFAMGGVVANVSAGEPDAKFVTIEGPTKVVTEPGETKYVTELPKACESAIEQAMIIADESDAIYAVGTRQYRVLSEARKVVAMGTDSSKVNNDQRKLTSSLNGSLSRLEEANYRFELLKEECNG